MPDINKILRNDFHVYLVLFVLAVLPYVSSINGGFVFDDVPLIVEDQFYSEAHPFTDCWKRYFWKDGHQCLYRPFTIFSYWCNVNAAGVYSPAFRAVNLVLHIVTVFIVFNLALRLKLGRIAALVAVAVFAVHPIHSEAVIPAFGRGELLCGLFVFAGLLFHTYVAKNPFYSIGTSVCLVLACWSKEHGVALLPLCFLYDIYSGRLRIKGFFLQREIRVYCIYLISMIAVVLGRLWAMGTIFPDMTHFDAFADNQLIFCQYPVRILSAINIQGLALLKFIWPQTLSHDYSYAQLLPLKTVFDPVGIVVGLLVMSIPFILIFILPALKRKIIFFSLAYIVCILPASNIITPTGTIFAERLYYIPSLWLCYAAATILLLISQKMDMRLFISFLLVAVISLGVRTCARSLDWHDQLSLSIAGVKTAPLSTKIWNNYAVSLALTGKFKEAVLACDKAIEISNSNGGARCNRVAYNIKLGNFDSAEKDLQKLISLGTHSPEVYNKLGAILANKGEFREALRLWGISLKLDGTQKRVKEAMNDLLNEIDLEEKTKEKQ